MANRTVFKSDQPRSWPLNAQGLMCANWVSALYIPPILFPRVKWLTLPPALLGMFQAVAHGVTMPQLAHEEYSPGLITAALLHVPIGIASIRAIRTPGPITRGDCAKSIRVLVLLFAAGVIAPNALYANRESPYPISDTQLGRFGTEAPAETAR